MSTFKTINEALTELANDDSTEPLLSESDVLNIVRAAPTPTQTSTPTVNSWRHTILSLSLAAAATTALVLLPPKNITEVEPLPLTPPVAQEQPFKQNLTQDAERTVESDSKAVSTFAADSPTIQTNAIELSESELQKLGVKFQGAKLSYTEADLKITIKTNGVSAKQSSNAPTPHAPKHISLYMSGNSTASWFDERQHVDVGKLVSIKIHLENTQDKMFPSADVVMWFEPTQNFLDNIPAEYRTAVEKELGIGSTTHVYTQEPVAGPVVSKCSVFPNPVNGSNTTVRLEFNSPSNTTATLYDAVGNKIQMCWQNTNHSAGQATMQISDLQGLPNGMYLIVIDVNGTSDRITQRLLIER